MERIFKEKYFLSAGEANAEKEISLPLLTSKLIDIATAHASSLNIGNPVMTDINGGWVLSRLTIEMMTFPKVNEDYTISTWIESFNRHFSERSFKFTDSDDKVCGYARSIWMVMDTVNRTNVGLGHLSITEDLIDGSQPPIEKQQKHSLILLPEESSDEKNILIATQPPFEYTFKYCDLDFYRHVNTVRYVSLLLNRFTLQEHDEAAVMRIELSFLHEAKYGMETQILRSDDPEDPMRSSFLLRRKTDHAPILFARIIRERR